MTVRLCVFFIFFFIYNNAHFTLDGILNVYSYSFMALNSVKIKIMYILSEIKLRDLLF